MSEPEQDSPPNAAEVRGPSSSSGPGGVTDSRSKALGTPEPPPGQAPAVRLWGGLRFLHTPRKLWKVEVGEEPPILPTECANCGEPASRSQSCSGSGGRTALVPYCGHCFQALGALGTRRLAATLAAWLMLVSALVGLPWMLHRVSLWVYIPAVTALCSVPALLSLLLGRHPIAPRTAEGAAVWWGASGLICTREEWARRLSALSGTPLDEVAMREPSAGSAGALLAPVVGVVVAPSFYTWLFPLVVVLNFGDEELRLAVGSELLGTLPPTSLEAPAAGVRVRLSAGAHRLKLESLTGEPRYSRVVRLKPGGTYLYAPFSDEHCFWLESSGYGLERDRESLPALLDRREVFWLLPGPVDSWFRAAPTGTADERSTGGSLTALRHAPCAMVPKLARSGP